MYLLLNLNARLFVYYDVCAMRYLYVQFGLFNSQTEWVIFIFRDLCYYRIMDIMGFKMFYVKRFCNSITIHEQTLLFEYYSNRL